MKYFAFIFLIIIYSCEEGQPRFDRVTVSYTDDKGRKNREVETGTRHNKDYRAERYFDSLGRVVIENTLIGTEKSTSVYRFRDSSIIWTQYLLPAWKGPGDTLFDITRGKIVLLKKQIISADNWLLYEYLEESTDTGRACKETIYDPVTKESKTTTGCK